ncbi:MAG: 3'-5' exonuclease [Candidatus Accumulibacter sp.]|nr:3'-5' exonuclease [Candidatus Accumulibacter conexus]
MNWFSRFLRPAHDAGAALDARQEQLLADWRQLPDSDQRRSHYRSRYVVIDVAVSSGDAHAARLLAIAAVAVVDGHIAFQDAWQLLLPDAAQAPGVAASPPATATEVPADSPMADGLLSFLGFVGKSPVVAHNARFIRRVMQRALAEYLGVRLRLPWLDLAWILPDLFREVDAGPERLDAWLEHFGIASIKRHDALSDAFATAQLLQIALAHAASKGFDTPASLRELEKARRHLHQSA